MSDVYLDLHGREYLLSKLETEERELVTLLQKEASERDWNSFDSFWTKAIARFYTQHGRDWISARETVPFRIAQDLSGRLSIKTGMARLSDYRDELAHLIRTRYESRAEFCQTTGLTQDRLTTLLGRSVHLFSTTELNEALGSIGYRLGVVPQSSIEPSPKEDEPSKRVVRIDTQDQTVVPASAQGPDQERLKEQYLGKDNAEILALIQGLDQIGYRLTILSTDESVVIRSKQ